MSGSKRPRKPPAVQAGQVFVGPPWAIYAALLFCAVFAVAGAVSVIGSLKPLLWTSVPCTILKFEAVDDPDADLPFTANARFQFEWNGTRHERRDLGIDGWKEARDPMQHWLGFQKHPGTVCYLPDGNPAKAVLFRPTAKWGGLAFVGFGLCVGFILIQAHRHRDAPGPELTQKILPAITVFFGGPGLILTLHLSLPVWLESIQVRSWKETPATVIWSETRTSSGAKHQTHYRADICYEYQAAGLIWRQNRIRPGNAQGSGLSAATQLVNHYPPGLKTFCRVDPKHPERALLESNPGWPLLLTFFPLPFLAVGILCLREMIRKGPSKP